MNSGVFPKTCSRWPLSEPARAILFALLALMTALFATPVAAQGTESAPLPSQSLLVEFDLANHTLTGKAEIEIPPQTPQTITLAGLTVQEISIDGLPAAAAEELVIPPAPATQIIRITYGKSYGRLEAGGLIAGNGISLTGLWHPMVDGDCRYALTARIPADFAAISEAEEMETTPAGKTHKDIRFRFDHPVSGLNLVAGPYLVEQVPFGDGKTLYSYFFAEDRELAASYRAKTLAYLARYEKLIGPYPYKRFSIVENRLPTGYAMPTFTLLGQAVVRLPFITDTSLGHEVLHSWFGNSVRIDRTEGNWCEGLTTYLADQAYARDQNQDAEFRKNQLTKYQSFVSQESKLTLQDFAGAYSHLSPLGQELRAIGYGKGSMLFHMLRRLIGDDAFYAGLADFYQKMRYQRAGWQDLQDSFAQKTTIPLADFFSQWLTRSELPKLAARGLTLDEKDGAPRLTFTLRQLQETPYHLTVPIRVRTAKGNIDKLVEISDADTEVEIALPTYGEELAIDPGYDLMRALADSEFPPVWSRFAGAADKLAVLPVAGEEETYAPVIAMLSEMNCPTKPADQVTDKDVAGKAVLFLGTDSTMARALFARTSYPSPGFTLDIRNNPLGPEQVAVLISASGKEEAEKAARKLTHYGKYSFLHFKGGRIQEKIITKSDQGLCYPLDEPPGGIALPKSMNFAAIMAELTPSRVVYVGETHTRAEDHDLQLRVIRAMYEQNPDLAIGMEMFGRTSQAILDRYINGEIDEWEFLKRSHYFKKWGYDYRFYRDILNFARLHKIPVVALNIEKEIVSKVFKDGGLSALSPEEQEGIPAERDLSIPGYRARIAGVFTMHGQHAAGPEQVNNFFQAQALWDEAMAESVADYLAAHPETRMAVVAGNGHTVKDTAIPPRVARRLPGVRQSVLLNFQEHETDPEKADYVLFSGPSQLPPAPVMGVMLSDDKAGVKVADLSDKGGAQKAGIRKNDMILAIDDEPVKAIEDIKIIMLYKEKGQTIQVRIRRPGGLWDEEGEIRTMAVEL